MKVPGYDAVLFDFDGVLADTEPVHWKCWQRALAPLGIQLDGPTYDANCLGIADEDLLPFFASLAAEPPGIDKLLEAYARKRELYRTLVSTTELISSDISQTIKSLVNIKLAVVTSSHLCDVSLVLTRAGLRERFRALICAEQVQRKKPEPDGYRLAASMLQAISPLVVEDSTAGEEAGRAAGFHVIRVKGPSEVARAVCAALGRPLK